MIATTAQVNGVAIAGIATKMSVVIPIAFGLFWFDESAGLLKLLGIAAGIAAVLLSAGDGIKGGDWRWPLLVFVGSGCIDASFKLFQAWTVTGDDFPAFITTIFGFALVAGLCHHLFCGDRRINRRSLLACGLLGLANFGTVYFIMQALAQPGWESSIVYAINNFGVVAMAIVSATLLFREKLSKRTWGGVALAFIAIALLFANSRLGA